MKRLIYLPNMSFWENHEPVIIFGAKSTVPSGGDHFNNTFCFNFPRTLKKMFNLSLAMWFKFTNVPKLKYIIPCSAESKNV